VRVLILGAGGHAQVVADILLRMADAGWDIVPIGYLDDAPDLVGQERLGLPVLGPVSILNTYPHDGLVAAVGDNTLRSRLFEALRAQGKHFVVARHPSAVVAPDVQIGPGTMICAGVAVNPGTVIGANAILNTGCTVDHHGAIGSHAHIAPGVHLGGEAFVGEGALVGIGATVMPRCRVGAWSIVGAASLVRSDVPERSTAVGVPARVVRRAALGKA
jgi:sugar O-acyltransferase (sialic acid O-acetyltransferase NeuD family)